MEPSCTYGIGAFAASFIYDEPGDLDVSFDIKFGKKIIKTETTTSRQLKEIQNKTNSESRHLVFLIFKKEQENDGVSDISSLFQRHCQTNRLDYKQAVLYICKVGKL